MPDANSDFKLIETLTRSAEIVLRRLIRYLVGKISLVRLQEMVKSIYIEEAEDKLKTENPTKNVALTKLALLTGLDTRTLIKIRNSENYKKPSHEKKAFMQGSTPVAIILDYWSSKDEFVDSNTGEPKTLSLKGEKNSFERLFHQAIRSRGITQQSIVDRLSESGAVHVDQDSQTIELLKTSYLPTHSDDQLGAFEMGYAAAANLMETIVHNFETNSKEEKFFQRGVWTLRLPIQCKLEVQKELNEALTSAELQCRQILIDAEETIDSRDQMTAGVSLFYFEDNVPVEND